MVQKTGGIKYLISVLGEMIMNDFLLKKAKKTRLEVFKFKTSSGTGHLASSLSCVDIVTSLYYDDAVEFNMHEDYLIFSKAHGSPAVYPILADFDFFDKSELDKYCQPGGILKLHSDSSIPGCHFVGGSLGNGIGYAAGIALANRNKKVFVILGDAELYEGSVWETMIFIAHHNLTNIVLVVDRNKYGILGATEEMLKLESLYDKFEAFGFATLEIDGHNFDELRDSLSHKSNKPVAIIAKTIKGKGVSYMEDKYEYHTIIPKSISDIEQGIKELS
jgi:transketolase